MKLDKRHLIGSTVLLGASVVYNAWVFTRPAGSARRADAGGIETSLLAGADSAPAAPANALPVPDAPDPQLDRVPEWRRNPFMDGRPHEAPALSHAVAEPLPPAPEADPLPTSILYSASRRLAIVDGRIVGVGETVQGSRIVDILPNAVVVESPTRGRRRLELRPPDATSASIAARRR